MPDNTEIGLYLRRLAEGVELVMGGMKAHIEQPETGSQVRYRSQLRLTERPVGMVRLQENIVGFAGCRAFHPPGVHLQYQVLPEGHDIIDQPAVAHKIEIEKGNPVLVEMKILGKKIKMAIAAG